MSKYSGKPDWARIAREVIQKLKYLQDSWEQTASLDPELHEQLAQDLYVPCVTHLARFCLSITNRAQVDDSDFGSS